MCVCYVSWCVVCGDSGEGGREEEVGGGYVVLVEGSEALNALLICCGSFPRIMSATALQSMSSRPFISR